MLLNAANFWLALRPVYRELWSRCQLDRMCRAIPPGVSVASANSCVISAGPRFTPITISQSRFEGRTPNLRRVFPAADRQFPCIGQIIQ